MFSFSIVSGLVGAAKPETKSNPTEEQTAKTSRSDEQKPAAKSTEPADNSNVLFVSFCGHISDVFLL